MTALREWIEKQPHLPKMSGEIISFSTAVAFVDTFQSLGVAEMILLAPRYPTKNVTGLIPVTFVI